MLNSNKKTNVIVLGKGILSIKICEWFNNSSEHNLIFVVPVVPEPKWTDSLIEWCKKNNINYIKSGKYNDIPNINNGNWKIDLAFSVFYDKIIKKSFIDRCNVILNLHNGPLPKYRGVNPINWALKNNEKTHGITIHKIFPGIDDGDIISKIEYSIYPEFDEVIDVLNRATIYGYALFKNTINLIDKINPRIQNESESTYYSNNQFKLLKERKYFTKKESI